MLNEQNENLKKELNPKDFLNTLENFKPLEDYQDLGYTLSSVIKICRTALLTQIEYPEYTDHSLKDLYNLLSLAQSLVPQEEMELLDGLKKEKVYIP